MSSIARLAFVCVLTVLPQWAFAGDDSLSRCVSLSVPKDAISARNGKIVAGPDLLSRGVVSGNGTSSHIARARTELSMRLKSLSGAVRDDPERLKEEMVRMLRRYFGDVRPAATMIAAGLSDPRMKIEIEVTARKGSNSMEPGT